MRLLIFIFAFLTAHLATAQQLSLRRIQNVQEAIPYGSWLSYNGRPLLAAPNGVLFAYNDTSPQWRVAEGMPSIGTEMHVTSSGSTYIVYRSGSTSDISILEYKSDGSTSSVANHPMVLARGPRPAVIHAQNSLFIVGCTPMKDKLVAAQYQNGMWTELDTLDVKNPESIVLYRNPSQHQVFMTITELDSVGRSTSRSLRRTPGSTWVSHSPVLKGFSDGARMGLRLLVPVSGRLYEADSGYTSFTAVDKIPADNLVRFGDATALAWCYGPDSVGVRMHITRDGGATFQRIQSVANIPDRITTLVESSQGDVFFSTAALTDPYALSLYRLSDTVTTRITPPTIESSRGHPRLTPIHQSPGKFFALPLNIDTKYDSCIYDLSQSRWMPLIDANGRTLLVGKAFSGKHHSIIHTNWGVYILQGPNLDPMPIRDTASAPSFKVASQCVFISDDVALMLDGVVKKWYRVDLANGIATNVDSDWSNESLGCNRVANGLCLLDTATSTVAVGVEGYWVVGGDSLTSTCNRYGVLLSQDTGASWTMISEGLGLANFCWDVQSYNGTLYALMSAAYGPWEKNRASVYRRDPGSTWQVASALPIDMVNPMRLHVQPSGVVYLCNLPIVRSYDKGDTWEVLETALPSNTIFTAVIEVGKDLVISTGSYLYIAENAVSSVTESTAAVTTSARWDGSSFIIPETFSASESPMIDAVAYSVDGRQTPLLCPSHRLLQPMHSIAPGVYIVRVGQRYYRSVVY